MLPPSNQLIPGFEERQLLHNPERAVELRWKAPLDYCRWLAADTAQRVEASKQHFPWTFFRGDCHSHTQHSDGIGTVAETAAMARVAGLDFQWVTDHWGLTQAPECLEHGLYCGQEPVTAHHHLGILGLSRAFAPQMDFLADYAAAQALGATVFLPHPTGWWPNVRYSAEQTGLLEALPSPFLMEIANGAHNIVSAFDVTDADAVRLWDHLLCLGRRVHALGNTDAHAPHGIGMVWNGVFAASAAETDILDALKSGHSFVSDAPLLQIGLGAAGMGDVSTATDREHELSITAVDSRGLEWIKVIADGEECFHAALNGASVWRTSLPVPSNATRYVRVEVRAVDARRAYSNPIYF